MNLLEVRGVKFATEGKEILHGVDFSMDKGETVVILGRNGAGKSTVAKRIMGILPGEGDILLEGENMSGMEIDERARAGIFMSYQAPVEIPGVSMKEMLWAALEEKEGKVKRVEVEGRIAEAVEKVGAEMFWAGREVNIGASGGERKRNEILQMMVMRPKVAILDEIDSGLDIETAGKMSELLSEFQRETGVGYVVITHNMRILEKMKVNRAMVIDGGRIAREGGRKIIEEVLVREKLE